MSDDRWIEVENDFNAAQRHFLTAQKLYVQGPATRDEEQEHILSLAFMHAMQAGYTSLESGMVRIMRMVREDIPVGENWQRRRRKAHEPSNRGETARFPRRRTC